MFTSRWRQSLVVSAALGLLTAGSAAAQGPAPSSSDSSQGWKVTVYPVLAWVPTHISIDLNVPPADVGGGDGEGGTSQRGKIVDSRFDGAFLGGFTAARGAWRIDTDVLWAAVGGDRPDRPKLTVDADIIYGHGTLGRRLYKDLYVTGGVRRIAVKYDIRLGDQPNFTRKPGVWDPLVGLAWHREGEKLEFHAVAEGGGFGVGSDYDFGGSLRIDWKPVRHFGLTAGYSHLSFKISHEVLGKTLVARQSLNGPVVGLGLYF